MTFSNFKIHIDPRLKYFQKSDPTFDFPPQVIYQYPVLSQQNNYYGIQSFLFILKVLFWFILTIMASKYILNFESFPYLTLSSSVLWEKLTWVDFQSKKFVLWRFTWDLECLPFYTFCHITLLHKNPAAFLKPHFKLLKWLFLEAYIHRNWKKFRNLMLPFFYQCFYLHPVIKVNLEILMLLILDNHKF